MTSFFEMNLLSMIDEVLIQCFFVYILDLYIYELRSKASSCLRFFTSSKTLGIAYSHLNVCYRTNGSPLLSLFVSDRGIHWKNVWLALKLGSISTNQIMLSFYRVSKYMKVTFVDYSYYLVRYDEWIITPRSCVCFRNTTYIYCMIF